MKTLLERNSEFDFEDLTKGLRSICAWGDEDTLKVLLRHDAKKVLGIQQYSSGLNEAALSNNGRVVLYWLEEHPEHHDLVVDPATVIDVSGNGFVEILSPLIKKIRSTGSCEQILNQSLQVASKMGHKEVVEYLVREGADVDAVEGELQKLITLHRGTRKLSALQAALIGFQRFTREIGLAPESELSWRGADASSQQRCIEILLANGADPNRVVGYEKHPLLIAATYCTVEIVERLISSGAHAETMTKEQGTALQAAAGRMFGGLPIIKTLLNVSASEFPIDSGKAAALDQALSCLWRYERGTYYHSTSLANVLSIGPGAIVKFLLVNLPKQKADESGYGLLAQMACLAGDQDCVELLLQRGMDVNGSISYYGTVLQAASRAGNIEIVERLFKAGANINILQGVHGTALRAAVLGNHESLVHSLIARGADVNLRYEHRGDISDQDRDYSVLHLALKSSNLTIFKRLLAAGADMNIETSDQRPILITACKDGAATVVKLLLTNEVDINVWGTKLSHRGYLPDDEASPLNAACAGGHLSVVRLLLDYGADVEKSNESSVTPLMAAVRGNNLSVVRLLLEAGANVNHIIRGQNRSGKEIENTTPLSEAAGNGRLEIVEELLSVGAIIGRSSIESNALMNACGSRHRIIVELLLENLPGNRYEAEVYSEAFSSAMNCGSDEMACLLLEYGMPPSFEMLRQACAAGTLKTVRMLVESDVNIDQDDGIDAPLLHVAASRSNPEIVQFLIDRGASVMLRSEKYGSPLIAALEGTMASYLRWSDPKSCRSLAEQLPLYLPGHWSETAFVDRSDPHKKPGYQKVSQCEQIVLSLFDAGADMDTTIRSFGNALHLASYMGSEVIVRQLLKRMEKVNTFGGYFESPLIAGVKGNNIRIVELLLNRDFDVNRPSPEHGSALHEACAQGNKKLIQTLLEHGADVNAYIDKLGSVLATAASPHGEYAVFSKRKRTIVESLLHHEPKVQVRGSDLLAAASWMGESRYDSRFTSNLLDALFENGNVVDLTSETRETLDELLHKTPWPRFERGGISEEKMREKFYRLEKRPR